jgi:arginase
MRSDLDEVARQALSVVRRGEGRFWLHVDLDILSAADFPAHDFPQPGGVSWPVLTHLTRAALACKECAGWSVVIYNPDLDPGRQTAQRVVEFLVDASSPIASDESCGRSAWA